MSIWRTRTARVAVAVAVQLALVPVAVAGQLSARVTGEEYLLEVAPLDPVDPFRGAYVALDYPGLPGERALTSRNRQAQTSDGVVYVPLVRDGEVWVGPRLVAGRPASGPYLRCVDGGWRLRCGLDSFFLPQQEAVAMERAVTDGRVRARVRVDGRGNAALVGLEVRADR